MDEEDHVVGPLAHEERVLDAIIAFIVIAFRRLADLKMLIKEEAAAATKTCPLLPGAERARRFHVSSLRQRDLTADSQEAYDHASGASRNAKLENRSVLAS